MNWALYSVSNPGVGGVNHAAQSDGEEKDGDLDEVSVETEMDRFGE